MFFTNSINLYIKLIVHIILIYIDYNMDLYYLFINFL